MISLRLIDSIIFVIRFRYLLFVVTLSFLIKKIKKLKYNLYKGGIFRGEFDHRCFGYSNLDYETYGGHFVKKEE